MVDHLSMGSFDNKTSLNANTGQTNVISIINLKLNISHNARVFDVIYSTRKLINIERVFCSNSEVQVVVLYVIHLQLNLFR